MQSYIQLRFCLFYSEAFFQNKNEKQLRRVFMKCISEGRIMPFRKGEWILLRINRRRCF